MCEQLSSLRQPQRSDVFSEKHIIFGLAGETYGLPILQVQEIIAKHRTTVLPSLPDHYRGVIWLRGSAIPIINLRRRLGFPERESDNQTRVIIIDLEPNPVGIEVDEVLRVATIHDCEIEAVPALTGGRRVPYVAGVSEHADGKIVIHLDIMKVLSSSEQLQLGDLSTALRSSYPPASYELPPRSEDPHPAVGAEPAEPQPAAEQAPANGPANSTEELGDHR